MKATIDGRPNSWLFYVIFAVSCHELKLACAPPRRILRTATPATAETSGKTAASRKPKTPPTAIPDRETQNSKTLTLAWIGASPTKITATEGASPTKMT